MTEPQKRERPAGTGRDSRQNYRVANDSRPDASTSSRPVVTDPVGLILPRLDRVRQYGQSWRADCPLGHTSKGTLSITTGDDGRLLMKCFAGCAPDEVLGAIGLQLADLFPTRQRDLSPAGRTAAREAFGMAGWRAALGVLGTEATVIEVAVGMIERGDLLTDDDIERVRLAADRIRDAREVLA